MPDIPNIQDLSHGLTLVERSDHIRRLRTSRISDRDLVLRSLKARHEVLKSLDKALSQKLKEAGK